MTPPPLLAGAPNFRSLEGLRTSGGRRVRAGCLYRSQSLDALSDAELAVLNGIGLRLVCDLRSRSERAAHPSRWPAGATPELLEVDPGPEALSIAHAMAEAVRRSPDAQGAREMMRASYRSFPVTLAPPLRALVARLAEDGDGPPPLPALVHCSAGKDRTGFVVAILLHALGVPREAILEDYLRSATAIDAAARLEVTTQVMRAILGFTPEVGALEVVAGVEAEYLSAALAAAEARAGSLDAYLREGCGLTDAARARLLARLTA